MRSNFVERLLARVDGEAATIWITAVFVLTRPIDEAALARSVIALVRETPRLNLAWRDPPGDWAPSHRSDEEARAALAVLTAPSTLRALSECAIRARIDLARDLPLRVTSSPLVDGRHAVIVQVHHAIGDARSVMHLTRRLWQHASNSAHHDERLGDPVMTDARVLALLARNAPSLASLTRARHRVLARRGHALRRRDGAPGAPLMASLRVRLDERWSASTTSGLFFGALLAAMVEHDRGVPRDAPVRLRVPVDLRRELGIGVTLENACSAVPIEVRAEDLSRALDAPSELARLVPDALRDAIAMGVHRSTALECLIASKLASAEALKRHVRPDLIASPRASTMVTTYVGSIDRYVATCPVPVEAVYTQTPTWGANGHRLGDSLVINVTCFEGLWTRDDLDAFVDAASARRARHPRLAPERAL